MAESALIVIPARMASTRFPDKPIARIAGKTMIERVWAIGQAVKQAKEVIIATDDQRLKEFAEGFGAKVLMTSPACPSGTDRVAEVALYNNRHTIFFNLQGDAVLTPPWVIEEVLQVMLGNPHIQMATPAVRLRGEALFSFIAGKKDGNSSGTTVAFNRKGNALYFSKAVIPYDREEQNPERPIFRHIGLYAYRKETLCQLTRFPQGPFERSEKLEQLRALENGIPIRVVEVDYRGRTHGSIDRPEDVEFIEAVIAKEGELL